MKSFWHCISTLIGFPTICQELPQWITKRTIKLFFFVWEMGRCSLEELASCPDANSSSTEDDLQCRSFRGIPKNELAHAIIIIRHCWPRILDPAAGNTVTQYNLVNKSVATSSSASKNVNVFRLSKERFRYIDSCIPIQRHTCICLQCVVADLHGPASFQFGDAASILCRFSEHYGVLQMQDFVALRMTSAVWYKTWTPRFSGRWALPRLPRITLGRATTTLRSQKKVQRTTWQIAVNILIAWHVAVEVTNAIPRNRCNTYWSRL